ncbi:MAG: ComEC/Rec2 family competence protein [Ferruginibacter sp.]
MHIYSIPLWKRTPFYRLLLPLITGITIQWYLQFVFSFIALSLFCFSIAFLLISFFPIVIRFRFQQFHGVLLHMVIVFFAMMLVWKKDMRHHKEWYGHFYTDTSALILRIDEPLIEKEKTFRALGYIEAVYDHRQFYVASGKLLLYFSKDSLTYSLHYGDRILIQKPLQHIRNSGNPGAFNYERYAAFQQIFHNAFLKANDWILLPEKNTNRFDQFIFSTRDKIVRMLRKYIPKDQAGIAEALLIGYKEDLDKDLVQAYSNAGVVHIIAISGLHLGLIYVMLDWLLSILPFIKRSKFLKMILLLGCLWMFSLLTGAAASVLRSAVMFTFIVIGKNFFKQSSIYNSLAVSAFVLLCYDPYFLWDVGFQLSYLALIGIVTLQQPVYRCIFIKQKWANKVWSLVSVTLAAQFTTFPICIYYFHQFPNLFFITNLIAVPLSTVILFAEILLIAISWFHFAAVYLGMVTGWLLWLMNNFIFKINKLPFSVWDNIYSNLYTTSILYLFLICICGYLLGKNKKLFRLAVMCLLIFTAFHVFAGLQLKKQVKLIIYNIPRSTAIDFVFQNRYYFLGDSLLQKAGLLQNFHLKPARIALQLNTFDDRLRNLTHSKNYWRFFDKKIMLIDSAVTYQPVLQKIPIDILIISRNAAIKISGLTKTLKPAIIVFDSSNSLWKIANWKKECIALDLQCFSVPQQGAFVISID